MLRVISGFILVMWCMFSRFVRVVMISSRLEVEVMLVVVRWKGILVGSSCIMFRVMVVVMVMVSSVRISIWVIMLLVRVWLFVLMVLSRLNCVVFCSVIM